MLEGLRKPAELVILVVGLLSYECPLQAIVPVFGLDERTVASWRDRAGQQCQRVQYMLVEQGQLTFTHVQADEIRVREKKRCFGWLWLRRVRSRLWLAGLVQGARDQTVADRLLQRVRRCARATSHLLICVDGWMCYPAAILRAFRQQLKQGIQVWPHLIIGQVIKTHKHYRLESLKHTLLCGEEKGLQTCLERSQGGTQINTAFIERLNGTMRERLASFTRKCRHANWHLSPFQWGMYLIGCTSNVCWRHHQLGQTPAMVAGITDPVWSLREVLISKVPPDLLAKMKDDALQELAPSLPVPRLSKSVRGNPSPAYRALLRLKEQEAGLSSTTT
jgi:IS1 family transposase